MAVQVRVRVVQDSEVHMPTKGEKGKEKTQCPFRYSVPAWIVWFKAFLLVLMLV